MAFHRVLSVLSAALLAGTVSAQTTLITDCGSGLPGSLGPAVHSVHEDGGYLHFVVENTPPQTDISYALGLSAIWLPIFGGILVPSPDAVGTVTSNSQGRATFSIPTPSMEQLTIFTQFGFPDTGSPQGMALSNAVMVVAVECGDLICSRNPHVGSTIPDLNPAQAKTKVEFKLTGGRPGNCGSASCTPGPCSWIYTVIVDNLTANKPNESGPGTTITFEVRSMDGIPAQGAVTAAEFNAASPLNPTAVVPVPITNPAQGQKNLPTIELACGGKKTFIVKISAGAYTFSLPQGGQQPPIVMSVPAWETYAKLSMECIGSCP